MIGKSLDLWHWTRRRVRDQTDPKIERAPWYDIFDGLVDPIYRQIEDPIWVPTLGETHIERRSR